VEDNPVSRGLERAAEREAKKDLMKSSDRWGQLVGIVFSVIFLLYFVALYTESTGYFTPEFTALGGFMFFGGMVYGTVPVLVRVATGRKNPARPFDALGSLFIALICAYMLVVFPLDFSHLGDLLPNALESLVEIITDDIAKILLAIGVFVAPVFALYNMALYIPVRRKLSAQTAPVTGAPPSDEGQ
jgi:hypothetical protein